MLQADFSFRHKVCMTSVSLPSSVVSLVSSLTLYEDPDERTILFTKSLPSLTPLSPSSLQLYSQKFPELLSNDSITLSIQCKTIQSKLIDKILLYNKKKHFIKDMTIECPLCLEIKSPTQCIEYRFSKNGKWYVKIRKFCIILCQITQILKIQAKRPICTDND